MRWVYIGAGLLALSASCYMAVIASGGFPQQIMKRYRSFSRPGDSHPAPRPVVPTWLRRPCDARDEFGAEVWAEGSRRNAASRTRHAALGAMQPRIIGII